MTMGFQASPDQGRGETSARIEGTGVLLILRWVGHPDIDPQTEFPLAALQAEEAIELGRELQRLGQEVQQRGRNGGHQNRNT